MSSFFPHKTKGADELAPLFHVLVATPTRTIAGWNELVNNPGLTLAGAVAVALEVYLPTTIPDIQSIAADNLVPLHEEGPALPVSPIGAHGERKGLARSNSAGQRVPIVLQGNEVCFASVVENGDPRAVIKRPVHFRRGCDSGTKSNCATRESWRQQHDGDKNELAHTASLVSTWVGKQYPLSVYIIPYPIYKCQGYLCPLWHLK